MTNRTWRILSNNHIQSPAIPWHIIPFINWSSSIWIVKKHIHLACPRLLQDTTSLIITNLVSRISLHPFVLLSLRSFLPSMVFLESNHKVELLSFLVSLDLSLYSAYYLRRTSPKLHQFQFIFLNLTDQNCIQYSKWGLTINF